MLKVEQSLTDRDKTREFQRGGKSSCFDGKEHQNTLYLRMKGA